jgi:hypothetical protein
LGGYDNESTLPSTSVCVNSIDFVLLPYIRYPVSLVHSCLDSVQKMVYSNLLNIHNMVLLRVERLIRPFTLLNLPPNLSILIRINLRSGQLRRQLIPANDDWRVSFEEAIDVFKSTIGCLWVEEVGDRDKSEADAGLSIRVVVSFVGGR